MVCLQGPLLYPPAEEPQIIRWPARSTPSRSRQSSGHCGPLHLQRCRRCRTSPARSLSHTISKSLFHPARVAELTLEMPRHQPPCLGVLRASLTIQLLPLSYPPVLRQFRPIGTDLCAQLLTRCAVYSE